LATLLQVQVVVVTAFVAVFYSRKRKSDWRAMHRLEGHDIDVKESWGVMLTNVPIIDNMTGTR
jgi:hypothetical protein